MKYEEAMDKLAGRRVVYVTQEEWDTKTLSQATFVGVDDMCTCNACRAISDEQPLDAVGWDYEEKCWVCIK